MVSGGLGPRRARVVSARHTSLGSRRDHAGPAPADEQQPGRGAPGPALPAAEAARPDTEAHGAPDLLSPHTRPL